MCQPGCSYMELRPFFKQQYALWLFTLQRQAYECHPQPNDAPDHHIELGLAVGLYTPTQNKAINFWLRIWCRA